MAQIINFLTENNLLAYEDLEKKAQNATDNFNQLSAQIKATEERMIEIANLKTHIINYSKTRDIYTAHRKAGYSKKFYEEHTADFPEGSVATQFIVCSMGIGDTPPKADLVKIP